MPIVKIITGVLLLTAMLLAPAGPVFAAPATQDPTPIAGTVESISLETDSTTNVTTVVVAILDQKGVRQTLRLSAETALALALVTLDPVTGALVVNQAAVGSQVSIDPGAVIVDEGDTETEDRHPVGSALADFFSEMLGVDYQTIMQYHKDGTGFGVIAQALWLTRKLDGDATVFAALLDAKKSGDYSAITLPDGSTPSNWGQFRKAILGGDKKANLGMIMSGRAQQQQEDGTADAEGNGHGKGYDKNKDKGNGKGNGNGTGH